METKAIDGLTLYFDPQDQAAAQLIGDTCAHSATLMRELWGLETPQDCRVYVMTSWLHFVFHSAPWSWRILLGLTLPLWYRRVKRLWPYAGGWAQRYGRRQAVGIKPPRLLDPELSDRSLGEQLFEQEADLNDKVRHVTCHELAHAFSAHLKLPAWLHEGLAMVTVDRLVGQPTVKAETLQMLKGSAGGARPKGYRNLGVGDKAGLVQHYAQSYWATRYLAEEHPELLRHLLERRYREGALEDQLATGLGVERETLWQEIDRLVVAHFATAVPSPRPPDSI
jgi:hypothetical protein